MGMPTQARKHGLDHSIVDRGGGSVIEVERGVSHEQVHWQENEGALTRLTAL